MKEVKKADFLCLYLIPLIWYILAVSTCHLTVKLAMITTFKSAALPSNYFETSSLRVSRVPHSLRTCLPSPEKREEIKPVRSPVNLEALNFILSVLCKGLKESRREPIDMSHIYHQWIVRTLPPRPYSWTKIQMTRRKAFLLNNCLNLLGK